MKKYFTDSNYNTIQMRIPIDLEKIIEITDPVYTFNEVMVHIDLKKYYVNKENIIGRPRYDAEKLLKVILFAFMENGYSSLREIEKLCKTDIRFIWLLDGAKAPSHMTLSNFLRDYIGDNIKQLFYDVNKYLFKIDNVDLSVVYIDGTKIEANANKYSWVWKRSCLTSRLKVYKYLTELIEEINHTTLQYTNIRIEPREEYAIEYVEQVLNRFALFTNIGKEAKITGRGHRKSPEQRQYDKLSDYLQRLKKYAEHIKICGSDRNSYSKTDHDATFMRVKSDYMGNGQLLPAYNMQLGVCDEYIAIVDAKQYATDMDCFVPLMEEFKESYGHYPSYPVADAGYGSYNNYLYCEKRNMEKYMKFTMYEKETKDKRFRDDIYRSVNFSRDEEGNILCPEGRKFVHIYDKPVKGNKFGRVEEIYRCENCEGCLHKSECCKGPGERTIRLNKELTSIHQEVIENLKSELGIQLRVNRSIQAEGAFGTIKWNRSYKRTQRRCLKAIILEFTLISLGFNLYKYHNKKQRIKKVA